MTLNQTSVKRSHRRSRYTQRLRRIPTLWARLAALSLLVVVLLGGMVGLTLKAVHPYREAGLEAARLQSTRQQDAALAACNDSLRRHIAYLKTPYGIAEEAHRLGYMRPGEKPLVILGLTMPDTPDDSVPGASATSSVSSETTSLFGRFQSHLRDL